jgi:glycosyltransferase involved in cell wall biosynthesis
MITRSNKMSVEKSPTWSRLFSWGLKAGKHDGEAVRRAEENPHEKLMEKWGERLQERTLKGISWPAYASASRGYLRGYYRAFGKRPKYQGLLPTSRTVSVVLSLMNEEKTVKRILQELEKLPFHEVILVINGSKDHTFSIARKMSNAIIVHHESRLGHDVGRAMGAQLANSDILLFLDGDFLLKAGQIFPFIQAIERGADVALNDINAFLRVFNMRDQVTIMKQFLNYSLRKKELGANSLTAVPHAMTRDASEKIGFANLMVPPKAQVLAVTENLNIKAVKGVNVFYKNKRNAFNRGSKSPVAQLIIGDHAEALKLAMHYQGERLSFPDDWRLRKFAGG